MSQLRISPSQIEASRTCQRRWYKQYVEHFKEPQAASAALGDKIHAVLEKYLRDAIPLDARTQEGRIAAAGLPYLPEPKTGLVEGKFFLPVIPDVWGWYGKIDWRAPDGSLIIDHKSTSDFKWAKAETTLEKDPQGLIYSRAGIEGSDRAEQKSRWIYYRTKDAPKAFPVDFILSRSAVLEGMAELTEETEQLITLRRSKFLDLPPNPGSCFKYGKPCPHKSLCVDLNGSSILRGINMKTKEELLAELHGKALTPPALSPVAPVAPPVLPVPNPVVAPSVAASPEAMAQLLQMLQSQGVSLPVAQPQAPAVPPPAPVLPVAAPEPAPVAALPAPSQETPAQPKRGPGRPPGSKNKSRGQLSIPGADGTPSLSDSPPPVTTGLDVLYVNCLPSGDQEYTFFPEVSAHTVVDTRTFSGRDNLSILIENSRCVVMPLP
jgi:hypothetical protein